MTKQDVSDMLLRNRQNEKKERTFGYLLISCIHQQYLANQERLHQNAKRYAQLTQRAQGAAGAGTALLQGLVTCGMWLHDQGIIQAHPALHMQWPDQAFRRGFVHVPACSIH